MVDVEASGIGLKSTDFGGFQKAGYDVKVSLAVDIMKEANTRLGLEQLD